MTNSMIGFAQDWNCIKTNSKSYFSIDSIDIHAIRIDSSSVSGDTMIYYPFKMLRKDSYGLYRELGDNWIGWKIKVLPGVYNIFYNKKHKPITIKINAKLNELWTSYTYSDSSYIEAKINTLGITEYLGNTDSVKTITFQLKNKQGITIQNQSDSCQYINSSSLILSKNYGLFKIIDFYKFPVSTVNDLEDIYGSDYQYNLIGLTNPSVGYKKLTKRDFYDFNIGDEIHWYMKNDVNGYNRYTGTNYSFWTENQYIDKVISKNIASNDSFVIYKFGRISRKSASLNSDIEITIDTILNTYYFYSLYYEINPDLYEPLEPFNLGFFIHSTSNVKEYYIYDLATINEIYYKNAGYYYTTRSLPTPWESHKDSCNLQYFSHGNYTWGTPFNFTYNQITNHTLDNLELLEIYPNPVMDKLYFNKIKTSNALVTIYDLNGKQVLVKHTETNFIEVSNLVKGSYIIKLTESGNLRLNKFIKE
jgi:hypothetical protein